MTLTFTTDKEQRAFELLQKYFKDDVEKHIAEVEKWYDLALKNGYSKFELTIENVIARKSESSYDSLNKSTNFYEFVDLESVIYNGYVPQRLFKRFDASKNFLSRQTLTFLNTKQQNEEITARNNELDELLSFK